jgi:membrane associated rhomboid family serine protease
MGIYDREYYRREGPSYLDAILPAGTVCKWLIALNIGIYLLQLLTEPTDPAARDYGAVTDLLVLDTQRVLSGQVWRLLSYAFVHSPEGIYHILFNMLFLWWFGSDLELLYGPREFLTFYLTAALLGGIAYEGFALAQGRPSFCLGASGAVTALLVLCACHFPHRTILLFFFLPVPIWLFALFNVAQDAFVFLGPFKTQVAVVVHLAGAAFAFVYYKLHLRITPPLVDWWTRWRQRRRVPRSSRLRVYEPERDEREPEALPVPTGPANLDEHFEAKLDAVLEKIARSGRESLTESERRVLQQASDLYKRRRT